MGESGECPILGREGLSRGALQVLGLRGSAQDCGQRQKQTGSAGATVRHPRRLHGVGKVETGWTSSGPGSKTMARAREGGTRGGRETGPALGLGQRLFNHPKPRPGWDALPGQPKSDGRCRAGLPPGVAT